MTKNNKILIVEDDKFISEVYVTKLLSEGLDAKAAEDGDQALEMMKKEKPELVLLDILMPKMNGIEVFREMKGKEELKDIPVIILTNASEVEYVKEAKKIGTADYLIKSNFTPDEVVSKIKERLNKNKNSNEGEPA